VGQSARSAQSRQNTWRFRVVNTESRLEAERLPEATFVAPLRIWEVEPDLPAKNAEGFRIARISIIGELGPQVRLCSFGPFRAADLLERRLGRTSELLSWQPQGQHLFP